MKGTKPNILIIVPDTLAQAPLAVYGGDNPAQTPNIDRLVQTGTAFTRCYCATPQCTPSKASLLTGLYPHRAKMITNVNCPSGRPLDTDLPTMGKHFQMHGYVTGLFGNCHQGVPHDCKLAFGFDVLKNEYAIGRDDEAATRECIGFIKSNADRPWLAILFYHTAHDISHIRTLGRETMDAWIDQSRNIRLPRNLQDDLSDKPEAQRAMRQDVLSSMSVPFGEAEWRAYIAYYNHMVAKMDRELGTVLGTIDELSLWHNTAFILTGDHGDMYGAHGIGFKGPVMYDEVTRVPLIIGWQGVLPEAENRDQLCHNGDIFPTVCELAGIDSPAGIDGKSLLSCFRAKDAVIHESVWIEYYGNAKVTGVCPIRCVVNERYKYVRYLDGDEELYDLQTDRDEMCNRIRDSKYAKVSAEMRNTLAKYVNYTGDELFRTAGTLAQP